MSFHETKGADEDALAKDSGSPQRPGPVDCKPVLTVAVRVHVRMCVWMYAWTRVYAMKVVFI